MEWEADFDGDEIRLIQDQALYAVGPPQEAAMELLLTAPPLERCSKWFWNAFQELGCDRNNGMGIGPIPFISMRAYADEYDLKGRRRDAFFTIIRTVDYRYLIIQADKQKKAQKEAK